MTSFLRRVLQLLLLIEQRLKLRLSGLQQQAVAVVQHSIAAASSSLFRSVSTRSVSLLASFTTAINTPIFTLHYPAAIAPFLPACFLSSRPAAAAPTALASPPRSPAASPTRSPQPSPMSAASPHPRAAPIAAAESEKAVLLATISHLHSLIRQQHVALTALQERRCSWQGVVEENREMRQLIAAQEEQVMRQQQIIREVRRELEKQVRGSDDDGDEQDDEDEQLPFAAAADREARDEQSLDLTIAELSHELTLDATRLVEVWGSELEAQHSSW